MTRQLLSIITRWDVNERTDNYKIEEILGIPLAKRKSRVNLLVSASVLAIKSVEQRESYWRIMSTTKKEGSEVIFVHCKLDFHAKTCLW